MKKLRATRTPLWRCPRCGHRFVTRNLWHSCGRFSLRSHFTGRPPEVQAAFRAFVTMARANGPVTVYAQKTRIVLQTRVRFAAVMVRDRSLDTTLWLKRRVTHPCLRRVEDLGRLGLVHHFKITSPSDLDPALKALTREARSIGMESHRDKEVGTAGLHSAGRVVARL
jgi:hypothetical protein